ncbi:hypothetical protein ABK040_005231 [Willaertia magna]
MFKFTTSNTTQTQTLQYGNEDDFQLEMDLSDMDEEDESTITNNKQNNPKTPTKSNNINLNKIEDNTPTPKPSTHLLLSNNNTSFNNDKNNDDNAIDNMLNISSTKKLSPIKKTPKKEILKDSETSEDEDDFFKMSTNNNNNNTSGNGGGGHPLFGQTDTLGSPFGDDSPIIELQPKEDKFNISSSTATINNNNINNTSSNSSNNNTNNNKNSKTTTTPIKKNKEIMEEIQNLSPIDYKEDLPTSLPSKENKLPFGGDKDENDVNQSEFMIVPTNTTLLNNTTFTNNNTFVKQKRNDVMDISDDEENDITMKKKMKSDSKQTTTATLKSFTTNKSIDKSKLIKEEEVEIELTQTKPRKKRKLFQNIHFVLTSISNNNERDKLTQLIKENGGSIIDDFISFVCKFDSKYSLQNEDVTVQSTSVKDFVILVAEQSTTKPNYLISLILEIPLLKKEFIYDMINNYKKQNNFKLSFTTNIKEDYLLERGIYTKKLQNKKITKKKVKQLTSTKITNCNNFINRIFYSCRIYIYGSDEFKLKWKPIIEIGGATIVKYLPKTQTRDFKNFCLVENFKDVNQKTILHCKEYLIPILDRESLLEIIVTLNREFSEQQVLNYNELQNSKKMKNLLESSTLNKKEEDDEEEDKVVDKKKKKKSVVASTNKKKDKVVKKKRNAVNSVTKKRKKSKEDDYSSSYSSDSSYNSEEEETLTTKKRKAITSKKKEQEIKNNKKKNNASKKKKEEETSSDSDVVKIALTEDEEEQQLVEEHQEEGKIKISQPLVPISSSSNNNNKINNSILLNNEISMINNNTIMLQQQEKIYKKGFYFLQSEIQLNNITKILQFFEDGRFEYIYLNDIIETLDNKFYKINNFNTLNNSIYGIEYILNENLLKMSEIKDIIEIPLITIKYKIFLNSEKEEFKNNYFMENIPNLELKEEIIFTQDKKIEFKKIKIFNLKLQNYEFQQILQFNHFTFQKNDFIKIILENSGNTLFGKIEFLFENYILIELFKTKEISLHEIIEIDLSTIHSIMFWN